MKFFASYVSANEVESKNRLGTQEQKEKEGKRKRKKKSEREEREREKGMKKALILKWQKACIHFSLQKTSVQHDKLLNIINQQGNVNEKQSKILLFPS